MKIFTPGRVAKIMACREFEGQKSETGSRILEKAGRGRCKVSDLDKIRCAVFSFQWICTHRKWQRYNNTVGQKLLVGPAVSHDTSVYRQHPIIDNGRLNFMEKKNGGFV